jgi:glycosyltransferase involved in cell wall biosynthesis
MREINEDCAMAGLSVAIVVRDESAMLPGCLARLGFADEVVVVVDDRTTDDSADIARAAGATVVLDTFRNFAQFKNVVLERCTERYVLVVDADERVSSALAAELRALVDGPVHPLAAAVPIRNFFYGQEMRFGGWTAERPIRLLPRIHTRYRGMVHEEVVFEKSVEMVVTIQPLVHLSHRSVVENLRKTASYIALEASEGEPGRWFPLVRRPVAELFRRVIVHRAWRDGVAGMIEAVYQAFAVFCSEAHRWELRRDPSIAERYRRIEAEIP